MALDWNTYGDFKARIDPMVARMAIELASAMRSGKDTNRLDKRLSRLWLLRQAATHFSPEAIGSAYTFLTLNPNV